MTLSTPRIQERPCEPGYLESAGQYGLHPIAQRVLANRATKHKISPQSIVESSLGDLDSPFLLPDIVVSARRVALAIHLGEVIGLETDHDVDGVTSHAVLYRALVDFFGCPKELIRSYIGHRLNEGYGLSEALAQRILKDDIRPALIITADNGSSDGPRITTLKEAGIDTVVTDHHGLPTEGPPVDAVGCVSPARDDSEFPDPYIAGVMVSFLLMCAVRQELIKMGHLTADAPRLRSLLDYVALGTVADCVSLTRSKNNRAVIKAGLPGIDGCQRPCWTAVRPQLGDSAKPLTSTDLAFKLGPLINACGRLDDAMVGVKFLLSESVSEAAQWLEEMVQANKLRREIEDELKQESMIVGDKMVGDGRVVVQVPLEEGHAGVHGIVASRIVERYGRPAVCFSPKAGEPGILTGSARGVEGMHVREAMQQVESLSPGILIKFGGHEYAGGLSLREPDYTKFAALFEGVVSKMLEGRVLEPTIFTDGNIDTAELGPDLLSDLQVLEPYGREFEAPIFTADLSVASFQAIGADKNHWRFNLVCGLGIGFQGVWFSAGTTCPLEPNGRYRVAFEPQLNWWKGVAKLQLLIRGAEQV